MVSLTSVRTLYETKSLYETPCQTASNTLGLYDVRILSRGPQNVTRNVLENVILAQSSYKTGFNLPATRAEIVTDLTTVIR